MAEIALKGRMKVKTLKAEFKEAFGATLRVYKSESCRGAFADDEATLASIRAEGKKGGELSVKGNMQVGNFEKKIAEMYGIGVQVANADDSKLVDNGVTLASIGKESVCKKTNQAKIESELVDVETDDVEDADVQLGDNYKIVRLKISGYNIKEIAVQPICDEEAESILADHDMDAEESYEELESLNYDYGMEKLNYYFIPSYSPVMLTAYEEDENGDESVICEEEDFEICPSYGMMSMEEATDNYVDDEDEFAAYKAHLTETQFEEKHWGCSIVADSLKKAWKGLANNESSQETFLPIAIAEALSLSEAENALLRGVDMTDEFDISFHIRLPKDEEFDSSKLNFICMDTEYEDKSSVLQEHLAFDATCLNMVIYDNVMYFAGEANTLIDGGYTDLDCFVYDYVNTDIESLS